jgi:hypothetical protein
MCLASNVLPEQLAPLEFVSVNVYQACYRKSHPIPINTRRFDTMLSPRTRVRSKMIASRCTSDKAISGHSNGHSRGQNSEAEITGGFAAYFTVGCP